MSYANSILITGGTSGLGYQCALILAREHPTSLVILASRTDNNSSAETINSLLHQANTIFLPLDLSSTSNVRSFAQSWSSSSYPPIQYLLLNAGIQFPSTIETTETGIEKTFATNHLGHALLFFLMRPYLAPKARIVITSSNTHDPAQKTGVPDAVYTSAEELAHPSEEAKQNPGRQRYSTSKLCNVLFMYAIAERLEKEGQGKTVVAFDPGLMSGTQLSRNAGKVIQFIADSVLPRIMGLLHLLVSPNIHTAAESGSALAEVTISKLNNQQDSGVYYEGRKQIKSSVVSYDKAKQEDLWSWTVKNLSLNEEERGTFEKF